MKEDWRSFWAGITTLTVADFILLTFDENPETVERQPDSRKRTTQILNAIESSRLDASFGYGVPAHRLLRPIPGIKPDQACLEHPANRMLLLSDALTFAVEVGKWDLPEWLHDIYSERSAPVTASSSMERELARAKLRIAEKDAELVKERMRSAELAAEAERLRIDLETLKAGRVQGRCAVELPHLTRGMQSLFCVMRDQWTKYNPENPPKSSAVASAIDAAMGWSPQKSGEASRNAQALASLIRPDEIADADPRNARRR